MAFHRADFARSSRFQTIGQQSLEAVLAANAEVLPT